MKNYYSVIRSHIDDLSIADLTLACDALDFGKSVFFHFDGLDLTLDYFDNKIIISDHDLNTTITDLENNVIIHDYDLLRALHRWE